MKPMPMMIAAARGALDAGAWACAATLVGAVTGVAIAAFADLAFAAWAGLAAFSAGAAGAALWLAMRIAIDRRLFAALHLELARDGAHEANVLAALDDALAALGWIDAARAGRRIEARVKGVIGLLRKSMIVAIAQWVAIAMAIVIGGA